VTPRVRTVVFLVAAAGFGAVFASALAGLPDFGHTSQVYGNLVAHLTTPERNIPDAVTGVNFDYRAWDTLGEEFMLFAAVLGVAVLLREGRGESTRPAEPGKDDHQLAGASALLGMAALLLMAPLLTLGLYIVTHGAITPGGGFQGGVILAAALLMAFVAGEYAVMKVVAPHHVVEVAEAVGTAGYALVGIGGLVFAGTFFENFLGLGNQGDLLSAGTVPISNLAVAVAVAGGFVLMWSEFFDQALLVRGE
jgi:multicomponent Na+:H+ antiporter subunit B